MGAENLAFTEIQSLEHPAIMRRCTDYLSPNVTPLIQPMDQRVIQNMKCYYLRDFLRKPVSHEGTENDFQHTYTIKDAIFNVACEWRQKLWAKPGENCGQL
jgi:hypothetical protein